MKPYIVFILFLMVSFTGCDNSDMTVDDGSSDGVLMPTQDVNNDVFSFFENELPATAGAPFYDSMIPFVFDGDERDQCVIINSKKDLEKVYTGKMSLPNIDFTHCTLVIARNFVSAGMFKDYMTINKIGNNTAVLNVYCKMGKGTYVAVMVYLYSWCVFPKFEASRVIIKKYVDGQKYL